MVSRKWKKSGRQKRMRMDEFLNEGYLIKEWMQGADEECGGAEGQR
jgi:hypothetical protein